jgi:hypothetical protein
VLVSLAGIYGYTADLVMLDEAWDITRRQYFEGVQPTTAARPNSQTWFFSAAHSDATDLTPAMMTRAIDGRNGYALFYWGADPDDDLTDPSVWRTMGPSWDRSREFAVAEAAGEKSFSEQWANIWPDTTRRGQAKKAMEGWASLPRTGRKPPRGGIVAIDESRDGAVIGMLTLFNRNVWYEELSRTELKKVALAANTAEHVIAGLSMADPLVSNGLRHVPMKYGVKELRMHTALLTQVVKSGQLAHDHNPVMMQQALGAATYETETGITLSSAKSTASILGPKLLAWSLGFEKSLTKTRPQIW